MQVIKSLVLAEVNKATFIGLWGDELPMALVVPMSPHFLKAITIMANMYAHV